MTLAVADPQVAPGSLDRVAVYTMFRGDPAQLLQWCNFHLNAGASRLYVALDCPGEQLLEALPQHDRIHWQVMDQAVWDAHYPAETQNVEQKQVDTFRWMARRARDEGHDFLAFVDADELLVVREPFGELAARHPDAPALMLPVKEMWYSDGDLITEPFGATVALHRSGVRGIERNRAFGWRSQFMRNGLMGHDVGKSVYRLPLVPGELTVHRYRTGPGASTSVALPVESGGVLHFDCGSITTWNAKWGARLRGGTVATGLFPRRRAQQQLFSHPLRQSAADQEEFFRKFFSLDEGALRLLSSEGLMERLDVRALVSSPLPTDEVAPSPELIRLPPTADRVDFQFALVCDRRFVRPTFATMVSVLAQLADKGSVRFVVLGDGLTPADVLHLRSLEYTALDVKVAVHDVTGDLDRDVGTEDKKRATFGRIYLIDYLPEQRTVYLDGDVLATRDFSELFTRDLGGACFAGVPDSAALRLLADPARVPVQQRNRLLGITGGEPLDYLNGGVLIFDLDNRGFRERALEARALVVTQGRALKQRDQDAMNIAFTGSKHRLESTYNYMTQFYVSDRCIDGDLVQRKYDYADASLVHFSGRVKPWDEPDDEFYNGLYRRLVSEAEERVGVSCGFYFSGLPSSRHAWDAARWADTLRTAAPRPEPKPMSPAERPLDLEILDVDDNGAYVRVQPAMHDLVRSAELSLVGVIDGERVLAVPLDRLSKQQMHLTERVGRGVRRLPFDLAGALSGRGGVARQLELAVIGPDDSAHDGFTRPLGVLDLVATSASAHHGMLVDLSVDGALESLVDGWLVGWYSPRGRGPLAEPVSLYLDGELAARRRADLRRDDLPAGAYGFRFNVSNLTRLGYGHGGVATVVVAGHQVPLRGAPVPLDRGDLVRDANRDVWEAAPKPHRQVVTVERARRLARRVRSWIP